MRYCHPDSIEKKVKLREVAQSPGAISSGDKI